MVAAVTLLGYFLAHAAAVALLAANAGFVLAVVTTGSIGNASLIGGVLLTIGFIVGVVSAWIAYRSRMAHWLSISVGASAAILGSTIGARFISASDSARSLGDGVFYSIFGLVLWTLAASGAAALLSGAFGLALEWLRDSMPREATTTVSRLA